MKKPFSTTFELNDTLYAEAQLEDTDTVYLWLGVDLGRFLSSSFANYVFVGKRYALIQASRCHIATTI